MLTITEGTHAGKALSYHKDALVLDGRQIPWEQIDELDLLDAQLVKKTDSILFGTLGAVVGGPVGAAVGASIGGLSRPCTFYVQFGDEKLIATGWKMAFNQMLKFYKIKKMMV